MNRRSILTKTGKGLMEATGKTSNLSRDLRNILKEIDGKVSVSDLSDKFEKMTEQKLLEALSTMERDGYVREFIGKQDEGPRTPIGSPSSSRSGPQSVDGSDLDFTAFTPAKPNAKAAEEARLQAQAQEIARQAQATRAREEAAAKARAEQAARAKAEAELKAKQQAAAQAAAKAAGRSSSAPLPPLINPTVVPPAAPPGAGILGAGPEAAARAQADAQARTQAVELERARREAEEKARRDAEEKARRDAEERAKAEAEARAKREAEERRLREIQERTRREEAEKAQREAAERAKREAEERAKREAEERLRRELEERARREIAERVKREEAERRKREEEERTRREAELRAQVEAEAKARVEAELRAKRESEERAKREAEEHRQAQMRKKAEEEERRQREQEEAETLERTVEEEQERARLEAEDRAEREEEERRQEEERARREEEEAGQRQEEEEERAKEEAKRARREEKERARAAAKARKAARSRERAGEEAWRGDEEALRDPNAPVRSAAEIWERRRPKNFAKALAVLLLVTLVVGVAVLPFVPLETAQYEKAAQAWLNQPVKIGSVNLSLLPLPQLRLQKVAIGRDPQLRIGVVRASPDIATLLEERISLRSIELENVTVPREFLGVLLQDKTGRKGLGAKRLTAKGLKLDGPDLGIPPLDVDAALGPDGGLASATFSNAEQHISIRLEPRGGRAAIEIASAALPLPIGLDFGLSDFSAKGTVTGTEMVLSTTEGRAYGGRLIGSTRLRWTSGWSFDGEMTARQMDAVKLAGPLVGSGQLAGKGRFSMRGLLPERMALNAQADGSFSIQKGVVSNVDMTRLLQGSGSAGGTTPFSEMNGDFSADPNRLLVRNVKLAAGLLSGNGQLEMDPQKNISGRMQIELRAQSVQARSTLGVTGTLTNPVFRRSN